MTWRCAKEDKPVIDILALVSNSKGRMFAVKALYRHKEDIWVLYDPCFRESILLDVTHYILIPELIR